MLLFVDTEFTSLADPRLISFAAVDSRGDTFYAVLTDYPHQACTAFVRERVLPVLDAHPADARGTQRAVDAAFRRWIEHVQGNDDSLEIVVDDECDQYLLHELTGAHPLGIHGIHARWVLAPLATNAGTLQRFERYFREAPDRHRHNALDDALALRFALAGRQDDNRCRIADYTDDHPANTGGP
ncbi:MAG: hypothetical protein AB1651_03720 [Pseudomonadota bacterium]